MKRLTLDETWKKCLSMWRWIAKQKKAKSKAYVSTLKARWVKEHGYKRGDIAADCFFCEYAISHSYCSKGCPGKEIDKTFDCTDPTEYRYDVHPIAFYNKLVSLNRKRLAKKKGNPIAER